MEIYSLDSTESLTKERSNCRASAAASALTLRMDIIDVQLCCAHRMTLMVTLENGFQTLPPTLGLNVT